MAAINVFKTHRRNSISRWQRRFFHSFGRPCHFQMTPLPQNSVVSSQIHPNFCKIRVS